MSEKITIPNFAKRVIYWPENQESGWAFILAGYCPDTLGYFNAMFEDAKKSFPDLKPEEVTCGKVTQSNCIKGFTLITFHAKTKPNGWTVYSSRVDFGF